MLFFLPFSHVSIFVWGRKKMFLKCLNKRKEINSSAPRNVVRGAELELKTLVLDLEEGKQKKKREWRKCEDEKEEEKTDWSMLERNRFKSIFDFTVRRDSGANIFFPYFFFYKMPSHPTSMRDSMFFGWMRTDCKYRLWYQTKIK